jgi:hypothetical protein
MRFPPLYSCSVCEAAVEVTAHGPGIEPTIVRRCGHVDAVVWANRKTTLYGVGEVSHLTKATRKITMTVRQALSLLLGRSI